MIFARAWMDLENVLNELSWKQKKSRMCSHYRRSKKRKSLATTCHYDKVVQENRRRQRGEGTKHRAGGCTLNEKSTAALVYKESETKEGGGCVALFSVAATLHLCS